MFAAMMAGGRFTYPRLVSSPATYDQTGAATVQFSPPIGVTTLYMDTNAGGGTSDEYNPPFSSFYDESGGGQGARADNLTISCADTDLFELTITIESGRGRRVKLLQNGSTVFDLRGGVNSGAGGDAVTPAVTGGTAGSGVADPGAGSSTSYLSGTVYSGQGSWYAGNKSAAWNAYQAAEWPSYPGPTDVIINGPGGGSNEDPNSAEPGYGGTQVEGAGPVYYTEVPDIARCVITW